MSQFSVLEIDQASQRLLEARHLLGPQLRADIDLVVSGLDLGQAIRRALADLSLTDEEWINSLEIRMTRNAPNHEWVVIIREKGDMFTGRGAGISEAIDKARDLLAAVQETVA